MVENSHYRTRYVRIQTREWENLPIGRSFEKDDGPLVPAENHDRVVQALEMVQKGNLSKRKAAKELNTSRRIINRSLVRCGIITRRISRSVDVHTS